MGQQVTIAASQVDKERLGYCAISLTNFTDSSEPSIVAGSKIEIGGALYEFTADETGTGWAGIGVGNVVYAYLVPSGASLSWSYSTTVPTWDTAKQGWYNGLNRAIFQMYKDASGYTNKKFISSTYDTAINSQYDLVIDSNAKLDTWARAINGQYKRVLIRSGTWTATALSPTAGVLINLDNTGTVYVFAEKGSSIVYSGSYAGLMVGLYHVSLTTNVHLEKFDNVNITLTNTDASNTAYGFYNCSNLIHCSATVTTGNGGVGFYNCMDLSFCTGTATNSSGGTATGLNNCTNISFSFGIAVGSATGIAYGVYGCNNLSFCTGKGTGGATSGNAGGFYNCVLVVGCRGQGTAAGAGTGYGFIACTKCQQNRALAASKTGTYTTSYADSAAANACADTAAGGYNS